MEPTEPHPTAAPAPVGRRRWRRWLLLAAVIVAVLGVTVFVRYWPAVDGIRGARTTAADLADDLKALGPGDVTPETIADLRARVALLDRQLAPIRDIFKDDVLISAVRGIGPIRDQVIAGYNLVAAADDLIEAANLGLDMGDRLAALRSSTDGGTGRLAGIVALMADSQPTVDRIALLLTDARTTLASIPDDALSQLRQAADLVTAPLDRYLPILEGYRSIDERLPVILGHDGERRYLVLAQNPAELRPTGGFLGTYGIVTIKDGAIASMDFHDVHKLDDQPDMPYQEPPEALVAYLLNRDSWELADANWSPDFPTSAQDALRLYTVESGDSAPMDGVIAITTYALDRLLEVTGPVEVPGTGVTVNPGEVTVTGIAQTRGSTLTSTGEVPDSDRKRFLSQLADEVLHRLFALDPSRWTDLAAAVQQIGEERLALAWFPDTEDQRLVAGTRWEGAVRQDPGDYLYAVDANVSPSSKLSMVTPRASDLTVRLADDGSADHTLRMTWTNTADTPGEPYQTLKDASESAVGQEGVFTRVLVPLDSEIGDITGESVLPISGVEYEEDIAGRHAFGNYLLIAPGEAWLEETWTTPLVVETDGDASRYALTIQKQPGQIAEPMTVRIELPEGAQVLSTTEGMTVDGGAATWSGTLTQDLQLEVRFR
ncbi:MAG: DUF4012 domain-containing protein [Chloroflexota bacterium]